MGEIALETPEVGLPNSTEDVKVVDNFTILETWANGNVDEANVSDTFAQSATVNTDDQTVKGVSTNAGSGTTISASFGNLNDANDQVSGIVLATAGLLVIDFQALWSSSVSGTGRAAIFIGANQLKVQYGGASPGPVTAAAANNSAGGKSAPLTTAGAVGLVGGDGGASGSGYTADVTTGQAVGFVQPNTGASLELGGSAVTLPSPLVAGCSCRVKAAPGTYTVSVQYKTSSGTLTVSNRTLWVEAGSYA